MSTRGNLGLNRTRTNTNSSNTLRSNHKPSAEHSIIISKTFTGLTQKAGRSGLPQTPISLNGKMLLSQRGRRSISDQLTSKSITSSDKSPRLLPFQSHPSTKTHPSPLKSSSLLSSSNSTDSTLRMTTHTQRKALTTTDTSVRSSLRSLKTPKSGSMIPPTVDSDATKSSKPKSQPRLISTTSIRTPSAKVIIKSPSRIANASLGVVIDVNDLRKRTPLVIKKSERKSRLPRANLAKVESTPAIKQQQQKARPLASAADGERRLMEPSSRMNVNSEDALVTVAFEDPTKSSINSLSSTTPSIHSDLSPSAHSQPSANEDPEQTPKMLGSSSLIPVTLGGIPVPIGLKDKSRRTVPPSSFENGQAVALSEKTSIQTLHSTISITLSSEEPDQRPLTRARSKKLQLEGANSGLQTNRAIPQIRRRRSRVLEMAQSFEGSSDQQQKKHELKTQTSILSDCSTKSLSPSVNLGEMSSSNELLRGITPSRTMAYQRSFGSASSSNDSPNLSALAESLSTQHFDRQRRISGKNNNRSSLSDMLRYSTMSTLGKLRWEDGAGDVLLTDPNETEAMVADISLTEITPIKPETESAALALASARAKFLSVVQRDEAFSPRLAQYSSGDVDSRKNNDNQKMDEEEERESCDRFDSPLVDLNARRRRVKSSSLIGRPKSSIDNKERLDGPSTTMINGGTTMGQLVLLEAQLARLSLELERSRQNEQRLEDRLSRRTEEIFGKAEESSKREELMVEELKRLEEELSSKVEDNVELENELDLIKYENEEIREREQSLKDDCVRLMRRLEDEGEKDESKKVSRGGEAHERAILEEVERAERGQVRLIKESQDELEVVREQIRVLRILKVSLKFSKRIVTLN
ncbi:hypothetical protein BY996DRAFT_260954 [Phakopsora pachyrhizi]|nr:hypothetical protein BY996DRAFT_260954 [Phakopsora pachyrhizi]